MNMQTNRRGLLGAMALAPAMAMPLAAAPAQAIHPDLQAAIARHHAVKAEMEAFSNDVYEPTRSAWRAAVDAVPYRECTRTFLNYAAERRTYTTADETQILAARRFVRGLKRCDDSLLEFRDASVELIELVDQREAELTALRSRFGIDDLFQQVTALEQATDDAFDEIVDFPASCIPDLMAKIAALEGAGWFIGEPAGRCIANDVKRIAKGGLA